MKTILATAALALALPLSAHAAVFGSSSLAEFNNVVVKEFGVGEIRKGNRGTSGDQEANILDAGNAVLDQGQIEWGEGQPYGFVFKSSGGNVTLEIDSPFQDQGSSVGDNELEASLDFGGATDLFLRVRAGKNGTSTLGNMSFTDDNGTLTFGPLLAENDSAEWWRISGLAGDWTLAGDITFTGLPDVGVGGGGSAWATQFKVAAVPVPAALPLALLGLGGFGLYARRQRRAA
jgi:hypothetical protein